jgi:hypothetical protein
MNLCLFKNPKKEKQNLYHMSIGQHDIIENYQAHEPRQNVKNKRSSALAGI